MHAMAGRDGLGCFAALLSYFAVLGFALAGWSAKLEPSVTSPQLFSISTPPQKTALGWIFMLLLAAKGFSCVLFCDE